jgi:hypothetical protein
LAEFPITLRVESEFSALVGWPNNALDRIVGAISLLDGVAKNAA